MNKENLEVGDLLGSVVMHTGEGGLPLISVRNEYAECDIYQYGAHVTRFVPRGGGNLLWMSPTSLYEEGKPLRGGVPICFPWFGPHRSRVDLPLHGLVRTRTWEPLYFASLSDGRTRLALAVTDDELSRSIWPYSFRLELELTLGSQLELTLTTENTGTVPFIFEDCLHTYLSVSHPHSCKLAGLDGVMYIDRLRNDRRKVQTGSLVLSAETVNAYMRAPSVVRLEDGERVITLEKRGFASTVVWNPGAEAASKNPEIGEAWNQYLCVESANCLDDALILNPGFAHRSSMICSVDA